jgi:2-dehydro-3-deoxy-D-arabinonate dehydratase
MAREGIAGLRLLRVRDPDGRVRVGVVTGDELSVLATDDMLGTLQAGEFPSAAESVPVLDTETCALPEPWTLLTPVVAPETWAAGVTYERSRDARLHESKVADVYDLVYDACRPELFMKDAAGRRTVGPGDPISRGRTPPGRCPSPSLRWCLAAAVPPLR